MVAFKNLNLERINMNKTFLHDNMEDNLRDTTRGFYYLL